MGELRIFPRHETADDVYLIGGAWAPACITAVEKRFTDAELAAEFEAARCDYLLSEASGHFWAPLGETWPSDHASAGRRASTLLRFATRNHYDQETP